MTAIITLTTDFGDRGPFVGVMKGVIWGHAPAARIVDLHHHIAPFQSAEAGFWLARSYRYFPPGTGHVVVVDPGVGSDRAIVAATHDGHFFLAPDNGVLPMVLPVSTPAYSVSDAWLNRQGWPAASATFHGRDIFAPLAACMALGRAVAQYLGPALQTLVPGPITGPVCGAAQIRGQIVAVDSWGNLITNIDRGLVERLGSCEILLGRQRIGLKRTYADAPTGVLLGLINSFDVLEIACNGGNAAALLGVAHGGEVSVVARA